MASGMEEYQMSLIFHLLYNCSLEDCDTVTALYKNSKSLCVWSEDSIVISFIVNIVYCTEHHHVHHIQKFTTVCL